MKIKGLRLFLEKSGEKTGFARNLKEDIKEAILAHMDKIVLDDFFPVCRELEGV